jgi:hypothetical protein
MSADDLFEAIREEFYHLSRSVIESVFEDWLICLQISIDYQCSYFPEGQTMAYLIFDNLIKSRDAN